MPLRSRRGARTAVIAVVAAMLVAPAVGATAAAAATENGPAKPAPVGADALAQMVRSLPAGGGATKATGHAPSGGQALSTRSAVTSGLAAPADSAGGGCNVGFSGSTTAVPQPDGGVSAVVAFSATISCTPDVSFDAVAYLVNRTAPYDGLIIAAGNEIIGSGGDTSNGVVAIPDTYPGANDVETVFAISVYSPFVWTGCFDSPGVRVLSCDGVGTNNLSTLLGSGVYSSGKKDPPPPPPGTVISLRAHANGDIVTADNAGASPLIANRTAIGPWEEFDLISNPDGSVSFRAHANGDIVTADNAGASPLIANRTAIGPWEEFDLINNSDGSVSFRAHANGDIVTADNAGASPLIANRTAIGPWEEFDLIHD